ncbi:MAG TPA: hypothetical protein VMG41_04025 [Gemmatimonadales bacterium]|nr:hypothetical protein [Gemmatimonadales bacterium]
MQRTRRLHEPADSPDLWLRIAVTARRARFAELVSQITGCSLEAAWQVFRPLPGPDGPWGVPIEVRIPSKWRRGVGLKAS